MKVFNPTLRIVFLCFFISHIPITICIDSQGLLPSNFYPIMLQNLVNWYCNQFGDILMMKNNNNNNTPRLTSTIDGGGGGVSLVVHNDKSWFASIILFELLFQLPFFFVAIWMIWNKEKKLYYYPKWFQKSCLIYSSHVITTLIPILGTFITTKDMTISQKYKTIGIYLPYLLFPLLLLYHALVDDDNDKEEVEKEENKKSKTA